MINTPTIHQAAAQRTAVIHLVVPGMEMPQHMGPAIEELTRTLAEQGIKPSGPMFSYHHRMPSDTFDFEVGYPVDTPVKPQGRVRMSELPAATVLRTEYHGPYEGLSDGWQAFQQAVKASGRTPGKAFWERYVAGPESSPDPKQWRTELNRPLID